VVRPRVEPAVLAKAWRLLDADPTPEVRRLYPKAVPDAEAAEGWHASLGGSWRRRFDGRVARPARPPAT